MKDLQLLRGCGILRHHRQLRKGNSDLTLADVGLKLVALRIGDGNVKGNQRRDGFSGILRFDFFTDSTLDFFLVLCAGHLFGMKDSPLRKHVLFRLDSDFDAVYGLALAEYPLIAVLNLHLNLRQAHAVGKGIALRQNRLIEKYRTSALGIKGIRATAFRVDFPCDARQRPLFRGDCFCLCLLGICIV